ncbi:similar to Saccharomyces cerevisiae YPL099C AIM43 Protein of unknown function [Maudiozyma barnettii]|uniref:Uncharacterized protein n=1 Tax=Maudiozyma barnettii TaxID=61262 RepID=A0A8H2ZID2_9SACH|nr:uncharacterized protein KABA2_07S04510 [Kazachstania barnettii]CAB4255788.1 similar to Saccharomyces cerevisiae YPL099C AIM43 Protein of unknown function [Kazachstania barnettii]CAD1784349.1 similar to Saccharomyces cerevisiae YPL099C AIM43 Protein of unknown function [Kazachstania barnettii]
MLQTKFSCNIKNLGLSALKRGHIRYYTKGNTNHDITSLDDLVKLESLDNVDPILVQKLINEKTAELNLKNEIRRLKNIQEQRENSVISNRPVRVGDFKRAGIMFMLICSSVYLCWQLLWWNLAYNSKEIEMLDTVTSLENELRELIRTNKTKEKIVTNNYDSQPVNKKPWYSNWWK